VKNRGKVKISEGNFLSVYTVFHKKDPFLFFFIIHSIDEQFT